MAVSRRHTSINQKAMAVQALSGLVLGAVVGTIIRGLPDFATVPGKF
jgi:hypothetical protein